MLSTLQINPTEDTMKTKTNVKAGGFIYDS